MADMRTTYLGLELKNPLVASASPLSEKVDTVRQMEERGVSAVVMYSLFEEQIIHESLELDHFLNYGSGSNPEAFSYLPEMSRYTLAPDKYVERLQAIKQAVRIPVIGSLNGLSTGGWVKYAQKIEEAGADALELNIYNLPVDPEMDSTELEGKYVELVHEVREKIRIPLAIKLSPFFTALPNMAKRLVSTGANGLVLFNRFYQPDYDLEELKVVPNLHLSKSDDLRLPLRWIALLYGRVQADFALTSGIHSGVDMVKAIMAGATVTMTASALLEHGVSRASSLLVELDDWMNEHEYESVSQMKGSMSAKAVAEPATLERANYMKELSSYKILP